MNIKLIALSILMPVAVAVTAQTKDYVLDVKEFSQLVVSGPVNVEYRSDDAKAGKAEFTADKKTADKLMFTNNGKGKLTIETVFFESDTVRPELPTVKVYSRFLKQVQNSGDSTVRATGLRPTLEMKASVIGNGRLVVKDIDCGKMSGAIKTGNGTLVLAGKCDNATLSNTGAGSIQADNLQANNASCRFFGTGTTGVWATDVLSVKGVSGKLYYRDKPEKILNFSLGVKIYTLEGLEWTGEPQPEEEKE